MSRLFFLLWLGNAAGTLSMVLFPVALALAVLDLGGRPDVLGVALAAKTVGFLVATPLGGVLADRYRPGPVLALSGLVAAAGTGVLALLLDGAVAPVVVASLVAGGGQGLYRPAHQSAVAGAVAVERRQRANALSSVSGRIVSMAAPALAAGVAAAAGARTVLAISAALWLLTALGLRATGTTGTARTTSPGACIPSSSSSASRMPGCGGSAARGPASPGPGPQAAGTGRGSLRAGSSGFLGGVREAGRHAWFVAGLAALSIEAATGYAATQVLLPVVSREDYGGDALLAAALTALTAGALAGAVLMLRWRPPAAGWTALAGLAAYGLAPLSLAVSAPAPAIVTCYALAGFGSSLFNITWFTATQREMPGELLARVSAVDFLFSYGLAPLGLLAIAPLSEALGPTPVLYGCAAACLLAPLAAALVPTSRGFTGNAADPALRPSEASSDSAGAGEPGLTVNQVPSR